MSIRVHEVGAKRDGSSHKPTLADETIVHILIGDIDGVLAEANKLLQRGNLFLQEDAPGVLKRLCAAYSDLLASRLNKSFKTHTEKKIEDVTNALRAFLGRVRGWNHTNPNKEELARMCNALATLLDASHTPMLSRQRAFEKSDVLQSFA
jgi:hypothetical protein